MKRKWCVAWRAVAIVECPSPPRVHLQEKWQSTVAALNAQLASISLELQAQTAKASSLSSRCDELLLAAQEAHNDQVIDRLYFPRA